MSVQTPMTSLQQRLERGDVIILDGGTGTELQRRGVPMHSVAWSAAAMATHSEIVRGIHEDYLRAGAEILITNSFGTSRHVLAAAGLGDRVAELNRHSVELAREARDRVAPDYPVWIAGSISSFVPSGDNHQRPAREAERANYREQAELLAEAGADLLVLEMIRDIDQSQIIVEAAVATGLPVWVGFTCLLGKDGRTVLLRGRDIERPLEACMALVLAAGQCSAVAVMHSAIQATDRALDTVLGAWTGPVACYPDCGEWENPNWRFGDLTPAAFVTAAESWVARGVQIVGGCCGIGPEHIKLVAERLHGRRVDRRANP
jgi:homocysteine S-methyltransferase